MITSTRQISVPGFLPAFAKAGCMTAGRELLLPCELVLAFAGANAVVRPLVVAPKQLWLNEINNNRQLPFHETPMAKI